MLGDWIHPEIKLGTSFGSFFHIIKPPNTIELGTGRGAPDDYCISILCHEVNHWAHFQNLTTEEIWKIGDYINNRSPDTKYHETLREKIAWWGTDYSEGLW